MRHLEFFGVENFRVFRERTDFELKSINILVGANSTGKSSFSKALRLFAASYDNEVDWISPQFMSLKEGEILRSRDDFTKMTCSLDFDSTDNSLRLGGVENVISKGSNNEEISFVLPYELLDYPKLGARTILKLKVIFRKKELVRFEFYFKDSGKLLIKFDFDYIFFDLTSFLSELQISDDIQPFEFENEMSDSNAKRLSTGNFHKGWFGLVDYSNPREKDINDYDDGAYLFSFLPYSDIPLLEEYYENGELFTPTMIYSDKKEELIEIMNFYGLNNMPISVQELGRGELMLKTIRSSKNFDEMKKNVKEDNRQSTYMAFLRELKLDDYVWSLFKQNELSLTQSDFVNDMFRGFFSREPLSSVLNNKNRQHIFLEIWKKLASQIRHHQGLIERPKYSYQLGEESDLNHAIKNFKASEKNLAFLKKWTSEEGFNFIGDITIEESSKYAVRSIEIGDLSLSAEGQGIAQTVSLLFAVTSSQENIFIVEEPENGLHPSYQSKLADFFIEAEKEFRHQFIIETHSEYLIRRLQYLIAKKEYKAENAVIYNFRKATKDHDEVVKRIDIHDDGSLSEAFYPGFYDEAIGLELELLKLKRSALN